MASDLEPAAIPAHTYPDDVDDLALDLRGVARIVAVLIRRSSRRTRREVLRELDEIEAQPPDDSTNIDHEDTHE